MMRYFYLLLLILLPHCKLIASEFEAINLYNQGFLKQAENVLKQKPKSEEVLLLMTRVKMQIDLDEAEDWIEQAHKAYPDSAEVQYLRGQVMGEQASSSFLSAMSYAKKSLSSFEKAVELQPNNLDYRYGLLQFHLFAPSIAGGDKQQAMRQIEEIKQRDNTQGNLAALLPLLVDEKQKEAIKMLQKWVQEYPQVADYQQQLGLFYFEAEDYPKTLSTLFETRQLLQRQQQQNTLYYSVLYQYAAAALSSKSQLQQAEVFLREYIDSAPVNDELPKAYWAEFLLAQIWQQQGKQQQAEKIYQRLEQLDVPSLKAQLQELG